jgi:trigger factor
VKYIVSADDKMIDGQVERKKQFGKAIPQEAVVAGSDLTGTFTNEEKEINNETTISLMFSKIKQLLINSLVRK